MSTSFHSSLRRWTRAGLFLWLVSGLTPAWAFTFDVTDQEFNSWPDWCKATFVSSAIGSTSRFLRRVSPEMRSLALHGFWHHCAGLIWLNRARVQPDPSRARYEYGQAISETMFNYTRSAPDHPHMPEMGTTLGLAHRGLGELTTAKEFLETVIRQQPNYAPAYTAMSLVYRDEKNLDAARDILLRGNEAVKGKSAEIHYFLGLLYLDLGDLRTAEKHAQQAYSLGYPLPGLRNKIERAKQADQTAKSNGQSPAP